MASKVFLGNIKGPKGDPGEKGNPGDPGPIGETGVRGSRFVTGNGITGMNTTPAVYDTGIEDSLVNDQYLNQYTGDLYRCTKSGDSSTAEWVWTAKLKGDAYTKAESDHMYATKDDLVDAYTKTESDETFLKKTDSIDAYTKSESDEKFAVKDDLVDAYTKTQSDKKYAAKTDLVDAYTKTESDETFLKKTDSIDAYTKTESDETFLKKSVLDEWTAENVVDQTARDTADTALANAQNAQDNADAAYTYAQKKVNKSGDTMTGDLNMSSHNLKTCNAITSGWTFKLNTPRNDLPILLGGKCVEVKSWQFDSYMDVICNNVHYNGSLVKDSYRGVKENIVEAGDDEFRKILQIPVRKFDYRPGFANGQKGVLGAIVDEVEEIVPEAVVIPDDWDETEFNELLGEMGNNSVPGINYVNFIPYLIGMVQLQQKEIDELRQKVATLENK